MPSNSLWTRPSCAKSPVPEPVPASDRLPRSSVTESPLTMKKLDKWQRWSAPWRIKTNASCVDPNHNSAWPMISLHANALHLLIFLFLLLWLIFKVLKSKLFDIEIQMPSIYHGSQFHMPPRFLFILCNVFHLLFWSPFVNKHFFMQTSYSLHGRTRT